MSDEDLRALGRAAAAANDQAAIIRYARALERAERGDEACESLAAGRGHADVRRELGRFPAWTHIDGDAGRTRSVDLPPIRGAPRVRWRKRVLTTPAGRLLASPLGVVCSTSTETFVLDPDSGRVTCRLESVEPCALAGDVLLAKRKTRLEGYDVASGELLHETRTGTPSFEVLLVGDTLVTAAPSRVQGFSFADPRGAPVHLWHYAARETNRTGQFGCVSATEGLVLVSHHGDVGFLDLVSGAFRFRVPGILALADQRGLLFYERHRLVLRDFAGISGPAVDRGLLPRALGEGVFVASVGDGPAIFDRAGGHVLRALGRWCQHALIVRDVVYVHHGTDPFLRRGAMDQVRALSILGEPLWEIALGDMLRSPAINLVAGPRRIFGTTRNGTVFCLEE